MDWIDKQPPELRSALEGKCLYGIDSGPPLLPRRKFEITVLPKKAHRLERFVMSLTMLDAFEVLSVEVADSGIHYVIEVERRQNNASLWLKLRGVARRRETPEVPAGGPVTLHVMPQTSGKRFTCTAVGGPFSQMN